MLDLWNTSSDIILHICFMYFTVGIKGGQTIKHFVTSTVSCCHEEQNSDDALWQFKDQHRLWVFFFFKTSFAFDNLTCTHVFVFAKLNSEIKLSFLLNSLDQLWSRLLSSLPLWQLHCSDMNMNMNRNLVRVSYLTWTDFFFFQHFASLL